MVVNTFCKCNHVYLCNTCVTSEDGVLLLTCAPVHNHTVSHFFFFILICIEKGEGQRKPAANLLRGSSNVYLTSEEESLAEFIQGLSGSDESRSRRQPAKPVSLFTTLDDEKILLLLVSCLVIIGAVCVFSPGVPQNSHCCLCAV